MKPISAKGFELWFGGIQYFMRSNDNDLTDFKAMHFAEAICREKRYTEKFDFAVAQLIVETNDLMDRIHPAVMTELRSASGKRVVNIKTEYGTTCFCDDELDLLRVFSHIVL